MIIMLIIFAVLAVLGIMFSLGRGASLIAGYNSASEKEKEKLDPKKLCRFMAIFMFVLAGCWLVITVGFAFGIKEIIFLGVVLFIAAAVAGTILANTGNRFGK